MTLHSPTLAADLRRPLIIVRARAQDLPLRLREASGDVTPASGTLALYRGAVQGEATGDLYVTGAITPGSTSTYALSAVPTTEALSSLWSAVWTWVYGGVTYSDRQRAVLVGQDLRPRVSVDDLYLEQPDMRHPARLPSGQSSWQPQITAAWDEILQQLTATGKQPWLSVDAADLYRWHLLLSLSRCCAAIPGGTDSHYQSAAARYRAEADRAELQVTIEYESNPGTSVSVGPSVIPLAPRGRPAW